MTKYRKRCKTHKTQTGEIIRHTNHKGFSLVELIVVVAIMAVLVGVLAPQYLRYVEKTRLQKDNTALAEIANAVKIAVNSNEAVYDELAGTSFSVKSTRDADGNQVLDMELDGAHPNLAKELQATIGDSFTTQSNSYQKQVASLWLNVGLQNGELYVTIVCYRYDVGEGCITNQSF